MACHGLDINVCISFHDLYKQMRVKINSHLDTLEQNILKELVKIKSKIDNLLKQLSEESKIVERIQSDTTAVKEYASDLQTFLGSKTIEEEVKKEGKYIMTLSLSTIFDSSERCFNRLSIFDLILSSASSSSFRIFCSSLSK
jgi:hypothetical protein